MATRTEGLRQRATRHVREALLNAVRRLGSTRVGVLAIGRVFSPFQRRLYRMTAGRISLTGDAPVLLLTTTGRRSGRPRTVPLFYLRDEDRLVVCNVNPGFERANPWTLNLRADGRARVQVGAETFAVTSHEATGKELDRYWPRLTRLWPAYETFYNDGGKRSIFILEPCDPVTACEPNSDAPRRSGSAPSER
jgi:deazaflavin-dependent nitroreductase family protein